MGAMKIHTIYEKTAGDCSFHLFQSSLLYYFFNVFGVLKFLKYCTTKFFIWPGYLAVLREFVMGWLWVWFREGMACCLDFAIQYVVLDAPTVLSVHVADRVDFRVLMDHIEHNNRMQTLNGQIIMSDYHDKSFHKT